MRRFAILGHPVSHSRSPELHNAVFKELGLDDSVYEFCDTPPEQLEERIQELRAGAWEGFSVTIPHKQTVIPFLDEITERAQKIGAVNTIVREMGEAAEVRLVGDNTDYLGFEKSLEEAGVFGGVGDSSPAVETKHASSLRDDNPIGITKNALVLGSGGAAQAVIAVLIDHGFQVVVASRNPVETKHASSLHVSVKIQGYDNLDPDDDWSIIVNTTPVGMRKNQEQEARNEDSILLKDAKWYRADRTYIDIIYTPRITPFLAHAQEVGAKIITGDRMFLWQAVEQARYFTDGMEPPIKKMEELVNH